MRTTVTIEDDVAARLKAETKRTGKSLNDIVNAYLRLALCAKKDNRPRSPFRVKTRDIGKLRPELSPDNIGELLEQVEGSARR